MQEITTLGERTFQNARNDFGNCQGALHGAQPGNRAKEQKSKYGQDIARRLS